MDGSRYQRQKLRHTGYQGSLVKRLEQHIDTLAFQHFQRVVDHLPARVVAPHNPDVGEAIRVEVFSEGGDVLIRRRVELVAADVVEGGIPIAASHVRLGLAALGREVRVDVGLVDDLAPRRRLCRALRMLRNKQLENPWKKHDNIPL